MNGDSKEEALFGFETTTHYLCKYIGIPKTKSLSWFHRSQSSGTNTNPKVYKIIIFGTIEITSSDLERRMQDKRSNYIETSSPSNKC